MSRVIALLTMFPCFSLTVLQVWSCTLAGYHGNAAVAPPRPLRLLLLLRSSVAGCFNGIEHLHASREVRPGFFFLLPLLHLFLLLLLLLLLLLHLLLLQVVGINVLDLTVGSRFRICHQADNDFRLNLLKSDRTKKKLDIITEIYWSLAKSILSHWKPIDQ